MYSSNRKRPGRKFVLETEIPPQLESKIRSRIVSDRLKLKALIDSHTVKKRRIEKGLLVDPKTLDDASLRERIGDLERIRGNLLRIISLKNQQYCQILKKSEESLSESLRKEEISEKMRNEETENALVAEYMEHFSKDVSSLVAKIIKYKEEYDKASEQQILDL